VRVQQSRGRESHSFLRPHHKKKLMWEGNSSSV
jgi:hypothetical protein